MCVVHGTIQNHTFIRLSPLTTVQVFPKYSKVCWDTEQDYGKTLVVVLSAFINFRFLLLPMIPHRALPPEEARTLIYVIHVCVNIEG